MGEDKSKIRSFTDLYAWQKAHSLAVEIYKVTETFPSKETFGLTNQIRRAAISTPSNIAEGFSRNTNKDKRQFYSIAQGSLTELQSQLLLARDIGYLSKEDFHKIAGQTIEVGKLINGLKKIKDK